LRAGLVVELSGQQSNMLLRPVSAMNDISIAIFLNYFQSLTSPPKFTEQLDQAYVVKKSLETSSELKVCRKESGIRRSVLQELTHRVVREEDLVIAVSNNEVRATFQKLLY
jgi:hypothetical protein